MSTNFKYLTIAVTAIIGASFVSVPASAAWLDKNLRNGMSNFSIGATVSPTFVKNTSKFSYLAGDKRIADALIAQDVQETDERIRLSGGQSAAVFVSAYQNLTRDITANVDVGINASALSVSPAIAYSYGVNLRHSKIGSIGINSGQNYRTSSIATSRTYHVLDTQASVISAAYTQVPNLTLAGYYAFPASSNVRDPNDVEIHSGHGLSAAYKHSFNSRHDVSGAIGYTKSKRHVDIQSNSRAKDKQALAAGLSYQYQDWKLSVDAGRATENLNGSLIDEVDIDTFGVRMDYEITPRIDMYASYGERKSKKSSVAGKSLSIETLIARKRGVNETNLFDSVKQKKYAIGADYQLYNNVSILASIEGVETRNYVTEGLFSKRKMLNYQAGVTFSF